MPATCGGETLNNPQLAEETCQRGKIPGICGSEGTTTSEKDPEAGAQPLRIQIGRREGSSEEVGDGQDKDNVANGARRLHENTAEGARKTNQNTAEGVRKTNQNTAERARKTNYNAADGARKSSQNAADGARKTNENAADQAWRTKQDITKGARKTHQNTAEGVRETNQNTAEGARKTNQNAVGGARKTNENAADQARETNGAPADEAVSNKMEDAINDSVPHDKRDPVKVAQMKAVGPFPRVSRRRRDAHGVDAPAHGGLWAAWIDETDDGANITLGRKVMETLGYDLEGFLKIAREQRDVWDLAETVATDDSAPTALQRVFKTWHRGTVDEPDPVVDDEDDNTAAYAPDADHDAVVKEFLLDAVCAAQANGLSEAGTCEVHSLVMAAIDVFRVATRNEPPVDIEPLKVVLQQGAVPVQCAARRYNPIYTVFLANT
ncbi:hypothetical protein DYB34_013341, partial [Aphanomyces astaci]